MTTHPLGGEAKAKQEASPLRNLQLQRPTTNAARIKERERKRERERERERTNTQQQMMFSARVCAANEGESNDGTPGTIITAPVA